MNEEEDNPAVRTFDRYYYRAAPVVAILAIVAGALAAGASATAIPFLVLIGGLVGAVWVFVPRLIMRYGRRNS